MRIIESPAQRMSVVLFATLMMLLHLETAQAVNIIWQGVNLADYNVGSNWNSTAVPDACCDEIATVNNNTTALLSAPALTNANALVLGQAAADIGGLRIANGGS